MRRLLLCPPDHYGIEYEINPWMSRARGADVEATKAQWKGLFEKLSSLDCQIDLITPQPKLPDMVFTANAGLTVGKKFIPSNFRHEERSGEAPHFARWMKEHGYEVIWLPKDLLFRRRRRRALREGRTFLRIQISFRHQFAPRRCRHSWLSGHFRRAGRSALLSSRYLLFSAAGWRRGLVSGGI